MPSLLPEPVRKCYSLGSGLLLPLPGFFLPGQEAQSSAQAQEDGAQIHVLWSKTTGVQVSHTFCAGERLPRGSQEAALLQACLLLLWLHQRLSTGWMAGFLQCGAHLQPLPLKLASAQG